MYKVIAQLHPQTFKSQEVRQVFDSMTQCFTLFRDLGIPLRDSLSEMLIEILEADLDEICEIQDNTIEQFRASENLNSFTSRLGFSQLTKLVDKFWDTNEETTVDHLARMKYDHLFEKIGGVPVLSKNVKKELLHQATIKRCNISVTQVKNHPSIYKNLLAAQIQKETKSDRIAFNQAVNSLLDAPTSKLPYFISSMRELHTLDWNQESPTPSCKVTISHIAEFFPPILKILQDIKDSRVFNRETLKEALALTRGLIEPTKSLPLSSEEQEKIQSGSTLSNKTQKKLAALRKYDEFSRTLDGYWEDYKQFEKECLEILQLATITTLLNNYIGHIIHTDEEPTTSYRNYDPLQLFITKYCELHDSIQATSTAHTLSEVSRTVHRSLTELASFPWERNSTQEAQTYIDQKNDILRTALHDLNSSTSELDKEKMAKAKKIILEQINESTPNTSKALRILKLAKEKERQLIENKKRWENIQIENEQERRAFIKNRERDYRDEKQRIAQLKEEKELKKQERIAKSNALFNEHRESLDALTTTFSNFVQSSDFLSIHYDEIEHFCTMALKQLKIFSNTHSSITQSWETFFQKERTIATQAIREDQTRKQEIQSTINEMRQKKQHSGNLSPDEANTFRDQLLNLSTSEEARFFIDILYRPKKGNDVIFGNGGTADGLIYEVKTGNLLSDYGHYEKALHQCCNLYPLLHRDGFTESDREILRFLHQELDTALSLHKRENHS